MNVTFVSNFMNHHQLPFSLELADTPGVDYTFISREGIPQSRLQLGYEELDHRYPFVLCAYDSPAPCLQDDWYKVLHGEV